MAISDVLFDASEKIRWWLNRSDDIYADMKSEIDDLLAHMNAVRVELDTPPATKAKQ